MGVVLGKEGKVGVVFDRAMLVWYGFEDNQVQPNLDKIQFWYETNSLYYDDKITLENINLGGRLSLCDLRCTTLVAARPLLGRRRPLWKAVDALICQRWRLVDLGPDGGLTEGRQVSTAPKKALVVVASGVVVDDDVDLARSSSSMCR